jgi:hypothetical protein
VSTPRKPGSQVTWETIEMVADKAERERLEALIDDEIDEELRVAGIDPDEAAKIVQRALQEASEKPAPAPEAPRPALAEVGARTAKGGVAPRTTGWWSPGRIAAVASMAVAAGVLAVVAMRRPDADGVAQGRPHDTTPQQRAAKLRDEAYGACAETEWARCAAKLDEARELDPEGEADPRVMAARRAVSDARHPDGDSARPGSNGGR